MHLIYARHKDRLPMRLRNCSWNYYRKPILLKF